MSHTRRTAEERRLLEASEGKKWRRWGTYLAERQWGTVREDYSDHGTAWGYFPHDHARSRAYRWGDDGLLGLSDNRGLVNFAVALWNKRDPILKERLFGLTGPEGNHGEDVKELYWYLDATPTCSYAKGLYKYPQRAFPYDEIKAMAMAIGRAGHEPEILETGVFDGDRYFDVLVEYAKADVDDVAVKITVTNRGPERSEIEVLPQLWFRNTWSWGTPVQRPTLRMLHHKGGIYVVESIESHLGAMFLHVEGADELLFTENDTNYERVFGARNATPFVKDAFHRLVIDGERRAVNPEMVGTKMASRHLLELGPGASQVIRLRYARAEMERAFEDHEMIMQARIRDADEFYEDVMPEELSEDEKLVYRQAMAGLVWTKQFYHFDLDRWLRGDPGQPPPPAARARGRNSEWRHLYNSEILSMPDKWEYPWYAAWDLAFHCIPLAIIDPEFAKGQLSLLLREWYMHPNGQLPAYEWAFGDVNPPVHAWAAFRVYQIERRMTGRADRAFLESVFHKLMLNFTWWVNRKDAAGKNVFQGGFLGLDNIGVFDRSQALPGGGALEQADATSWMGMYCLNLLSIALELARENPSYQDVANKFFEHFLYIAHAMNDVAGEGIRLWDEEDGFFYDVMRMPSGCAFRMKVRSMVGLIPLFAVETLNQGIAERYPAFVRRVRWFIENRPELAEYAAGFDVKGSEGRRLLSILDEERLRRILKRLLDEDEFLSPYGVRALSRHHAEHPYILKIDGAVHRVDYEPAESSSGIFGGNSNWRGPVWFPVNYLLIESLQKFHHFYGDDFKVECPTGSGKYMTLWEVASEISDRLIRLFLRGPDGRRPAHGYIDRLQSDPHFKDHLFFFEYFHGDNGAGIGAAHQTGWTALVAKLLHQSRLWKRRGAR
jgi:hypothetical protein